MRQGEPRVPALAAGDDQAYLAAASAETVRARWLGVEIESFVTLMLAGRGQVLTATADIVKSGSPLVITVPHSLCEASTMMLER
jgi:hypothetical protein